MMRLIVYSHDAYGLGNIRRMLAICKYLADTVPEISILLISGSPILHSFRMPRGLDYIKLPCLGRDESGEISAKYLKKDPQEIAKLRAEIIKTAVANFKPDLILVDKKPYGLQEELKAAIDYLKQYLPTTKLVLLLRDILDAPEITIENWKKNNYYKALRQHYDQILVVGMPEIFDVIKEYQFSRSLAKKTKYCGYIRREYGWKTPQAIRQELKVKSKEKLILVTPGGGGDGYHLVKHYLEGLAQLNSRHNLKTLIFSGSEMLPQQREKLVQLAQRFSHVTILEFTDDLSSYMNAADAVVCMAGYNTICEVLSLGKKAVVVPRITPVQEQWIRAKNMANLGLFKIIHPEELTAKHLLESVLEQLKNDVELPKRERLDLNALPQIQQHLYNLLFSDTLLNYKSPFTLTHHQSSLAIAN